MSSTGVTHDADAFCRECKRLYRIQQADRAAAGDLDALATHRRPILELFQQLYLHNLAGASSSQAFETAWRCTWYSAITLLRSMSADQAEAAAAHLRGTCLQALAFYKTAAHHAQARYGPVAAAAQAPLEAEAAAQADREFAATAGALPPAEPADCSAFVHLCLLKMGDLARYLAQGQAGASAAEQRGAWEVCSTYYLKARALAPRSGKPHNQLAVVEEARDGGGLQVCVGACMRFALASCAAEPMATAEKNWARCVGGHRAALTERLPMSRLHTLSADNMKFTHLVQTVTMLLVGAFGSGVDELDVDKCAPRWQACAPLLRALFAAPAYGKAARVRPPHRDFGVAAALFASLCAWCAFQRMKGCADQVEAVRKSAVYTCMSALLLRLAALLAESLRDCLAAAAAANASAERVSPSLAAGGRLLAALRLALATCATVIDGNALAVASSDLADATAALEALPPALAVGFLVAGGGDAPLPEAQLVRGCALFASWQGPAPSDAEPEVVRVVHSGGGAADVAATEALGGAGPAGFGLRADAIEACGCECGRLGELAEGAQWHDGTRECGHRLRAAAAALAGCAERHTAVEESAGAAPTQIQEPGAAADEINAVQREASDPFASGAPATAPTQRMASADSDDLDEVLMQPGEGWAGAPPRSGELGCASPFASFGASDAAAAASAVAAAEAIFATPPPREHESLARELELPSSLHLGQAEGADRGALGGAQRGASGGSAGAACAVEDLSLAAEVGLPASLQLESSMRAEAAADNAAAAAARRAGTLPQLGEEDVGEESTSIGEEAEAGGLSSSPQSGALGAVGADTESQSSDAAADPYSKELHERSEVEHAE